MKFKGCFILCSALLFISGCSKNTVNTSTTKADLVLTEGKIYTLNKQQPWAEAIAVKEGKIIYVGKNEEAKAYIGENTQIQNLAGRMLMPGINDAHVHPTRGGTKALFECNFAFNATPETIAARVAECVADNPGATWIRGGQWDSGFFERFDIPSPKAFLDAVSGDKAVILNDDSNHNGWANSKALALAGITKETRDLSDGTYVRDPISGELTGLLLENAEQMLSDQVPDWSTSEYIRGAAEGIRIANSFGITGMKDASATPEVMHAYKTLDGKNQFTVHMSTSIKTPYGYRDGLLDYDHIDQLREKYKSQHINTSAVKIFMDGVPTSSRTAAMIEPYTAATPDSPRVSGMLHIEPSLLAQDLIELDKRGYTVKIHVAGDRAVRVALDAISAARKANGQSNLKHELAHAGFIDEKDIKRFAELNAVADLSPYLWHPSPIIDSIIAAVGSPKGEQYWPIKSLTEAKAPLLAGSDWPAAVESIDPWVGIEAMVTRTDPKEKFSGALWPEQAISLEQALEIYTLHGAAAIGLSDKTGTIMEGKYADFIILNQKLFEIPASKISETQVLETWFEGKLVYKR